MEKRNGPVEGNQICDPVACTAKSLGSLVQIDSIAIDLSCAIKETELHEHEHFSIRGFVSGLRKKDGKICSLFASDDHLVDSLPPLSVPKFRLWQCSNCIPEISMERTAKEVLLADRCIAGTSSCNDFDGDVLVSHNREKSGNKVSRKYLDWKDNYLSKNAINANLVRSEAYKTALCSKDKADVWIKEDGNSSANVPGAGTVQVKDVDENSADVFGEPYNAFSESNGTLSATPHKRKQKKRLLADIMEEEHQTYENTRTRCASFSEIQLTSTAMESISANPPWINTFADVAKGSRSPKKKRKTALGEYRRPLEITNTVGETNHLRGLILGVERSCRRVDTSDSESGGEAHIQIHSQFSAKTQRIKTKNSKAIDINKKMKSVHINNETVKLQEMPKINVTYSTNLLKDTNSADADVCNLGPVSSTLGEMGQCARSFLSTQQMEMNFNQRREIRTDHNSSLHCSKSFSGDPNINAKVGLDLSLNTFMDAQRNSNNHSSLRQHRVIPDLNETFTQKPDVARGKQLPTFFEERTFPMHDTDVSISHSKKTILEGERQLRAANIPTVLSEDNNMEVGGALDDIPVEIIELLAKNKREREHRNLRRRFLPVGMNSSIVGSPTALYADGFSSMINFPFANVRTGVPMRSGNFGVGQSEPINFPHLNGYQLDTRKLEENQFKIITSFAPNEQSQYSASSSIMAAAPRPCEGGDLLWPPRRENVPFNFRVTQNYSITSNSLGGCSFPDQCNKRKTISDIKDREGKKAVLGTSVSNEVRMRSSPKSVGSLDPHPNDAIPAMQLLSLMDQGIVSGSSVKLNPKNFFDKPFSPCDHHPRLNGNENQKFLSGSFFSQNRHVNDFSALRCSVYAPGESSKKVSHHSQGCIPPEHGNSNAVSSGSPSNVGAQSSRCKLALDNCILNQNPADFSIPDAKNEFTISAKDLKRKNWNSSKERRSVNVEGNKRLRKNSLGKGSSKK